MDIKEIIKSVLPNKYKVKLHVSRLPIINDRNKLEEVYKNWLTSGKPLPPPHIVKQKEILKAKKISNANIFVETGTCFGDMVYAMLDNFTKLYSIEISDLLYNEVTKFFKDYNKVHLLKGDSADKIVEVLAELKEPALFWLDGHYSGTVTSKGELNTPIYKELTEVFNSPYDHHILIDDAREFVGANDYPTLEDLKSFVYSKGNYIFNVENDIISIYKQH